MRALVTIAIATVAMLSLSLTVEANDVVRQFDQEWRRARNPLEKRDAALTLDGIGVQGLTAFDTILADPYWTIRTTAINQLTNLNSAADRAKVAEHMLKVRDPKAKLQYFWAYSNSHLAEPDEWKVLHNYLHDDKAVKAEDWAIKHTIARGMFRWIGPRLSVAGVSASDEEREQIEARNKQIMDRLNPIFRANFDAYLKLLKHMQSDRAWSRWLGDRRGDKNAKLLKWLVVYGLEKITGEEGGDNPDYWEILSGELERGTKGFNYRHDDERTDFKVGDINVGARTDVRQKPERLTGVHLLLMPSDRSDLYFAPYDREFTRYFKISSFIKPDGAEHGRRHPQHPNSAYFYPTGKIAEMFRETRRGQGGMIGMLCVNDSSYLAMEYAASDPDGCAFIICVGAWSGPQAMTQGRQRAENSKDDAIKFYYRSLYFPAPREEYDDLKNFHKDTGGHSHRFADPHNPDIYYMIQKIREAPAVGGSGLQPLVDTDYKFEGRSIDVPALFIFGDKDEAANQRQVQNELARSFRNSSFVTLPGTSLMPWLEDPIGFFEAFEQFMNEKKVWERIEKFREKEEEDKKGGGRRR
jgi:hypothetical protein